MSLTSRTGFALGLSAASATALVALSPSPALAVPPGGYAELVENVSPSVVYVEVTVQQNPRQARHDAPSEPEPHKGQRHGNKEAQPRQAPRGFDPFFGFPFPDRGEQLRPQRPMKSAGSGFIIDQDGLIVTNNHVVADAESVTITLSDGSKHDAEVVGTDPLTDVALLQISVDDALPVVAFGSSDELRVGEEVIAMGSPFGLSGTVTSGIVSATSRNINAGPFDDFIQTDAAINRGNSGGPLFNAEGDVVGVNTAIFSSHGGSVGIGFAVPSDLVREIVADLQDDGEVERGWLGVQIRPVSDEVANVLGLEAGQGVMIDSIVADSPAETAGLHKGDIVLKFAGEEVGELRDLTRAVALNDPESQTQIEVLRRGKELTIDVTLGNRADQEV